MGIRASATGDGARESTCIRSIHRRGSRLVGNAAVGAAVSGLAGSTARIGRVIPPAEER
jgi:hypothetical protein